ncbi:MAG: tetratricopeptide repeat protein [Nostoc sp.]|uniref:tetratricopeptide repeat protein n=1 Tax=Nostoc sp. TaxID=1180 RepID=UPI002FF886BC
MYQELSAGKQIAEAVACTYQALIKNKARDWHLLRLYAAGNLPSSLVTPLRTRGRKPAPTLSVSTQFLDTAGKVKVPTRESFVGRRRQLQSCLRVLSQSTDEVGVLIHGMGGLGKSSLAARLCDRLPNFERVVWVGRIDEASLVSRLAEKLDDNEQRKSLQNYDEELKYRLRRVFQDLHEQAKPFLLVLDDFEVNLETSPPTPLRGGEGSPVPPFPAREGGLGGLGHLQTEAAEVMKALVWAIKENYTSHRIIITCRYDFEFTLLQYFHKQPLDALQGADLQKKFNRLTAFSAKSQVDEALKSQAQKLADGNPRLLEWLDKILQNTTVDVAAILNRLAADPVELREQVLAEALLQQMDSTMREMLARGLVFELPIPREALAAVCENIPNLEDYISRAVALGLLEVSHDEALRVPRILPVQLPEDGEALHKQAVEVLYRLWWENPETLTEEKGLEIHRLALQGKVENIAVVVAKILTNRLYLISRFREAVEVCRGTLEISENYRIIYELAKSEQELGLFEQALEHSQKVLTLCPLEDIIQRAATLHQLGSLKLNVGEINEAIILYEQSLVFKKQIGNVQGMAATLHDLGYLKANRGEIDEAITLYKQSLALKEQIGDTLGQASTLHCLGILKANQGEISEAITLYKQSLDLNEQIGNVKGIAATLHCLGILKANQGKINEAITLYEESLIIHKQIGNIQAQAATLNNLGRIKADRREINEATTLYEQSLVLTEQISDVTTKATTLHNLGSLKADTGEISEAIALYEQSLVLTEQMGNIKSIAATLHEIARLKANTGEINEAIPLFEQSLAITKKIGDVQSQAITLSWLGGLAEQQGDYNQALDYLQPALEILQHIQSPDAERVRQMVARVQDLIRNS